MVDEAVPIEPGMKVVIVDDWGGNVGQNPNGLMDKWLGQTMTVRYTIGNTNFAMYEDIGDVPGAVDYGWSWNRHMLKEVLGFMDEELVELELGYENMEQIL